MPEKTEYQKSTVEFIKQRIRFLNGIVLLITVVALLLIIRFVYQYVDYMPVSSVVAMLIIIAGLAVIVYYVSRVTSSKAVKAIDGYSSKLSTLLTTTRNVHRIGYIDVLLEEVMDIAMAMLKADGGSLFLREGENLVFKKVKGIKTEKLTGTSIWVADHGSSIRIEDAKDDQRFYPEADETVGWEIRSVLCVPLKLQSEVIGALELVRKEKGAFSPEDEELLCYYAEQAALSLVKTRFYEDKKNYEIHLTDILVDAIENLSQKRGHAKRIARYTLLMADAMHMSEEYKSRLYRASMLHDIGFLKIRIEEVSSIEDYKQHSVIGYGMLKPINIYTEITPIVLHHHERYDGSGYPSRLKGDAIPIESRMICIAEAFDAMVSHQSYKNVGTGKVVNEDVLPSVVRYDSAMEELVKYVGIQFDPELVRVFRQVITEEELDLK